jgi:hypothetical protein
MTVYTFRKSVITKPEVWQVTEKGLVYSTDGNPLVCPYQNIKSIRLKYAPSRAKTNNFTCTIEFHGTAFKSIISSISYLSFGNFEDQGKQYRLFIKELILATLKANDKCQFFSGKNWVNFITEYVGVTLMLGLLLWIFIALSTSATNYVAIKILIIVYSCYYLAKGFIINKPGKFDPYQIPEKLFPTLTPSA